MIIVHHESYTLPQSVCGVFMADIYKAEMEQKGLKVAVENTTKTITLSGSYVGDIPNSFIKDLMESRKGDGK